jgi:DNA-binding LacI/PurR family transcriptional regulator
VSFRLPLANHCAPSRPAVTRSCDKIAPAVSLTVEEGGSILVTINDVAKHAGVSNATVSRVLANKPHVTEAMRERVMQAITELKYNPDHTARRLRQQSESRVIGVLMRSVENHHFGTMLQGICDAAFRHQLTMIFYNIDFELHKQAFFLSVIQSERSAGLIVSPLNSQDNLDTLERVHDRGTAVVMADSTIQGWKYDAVRSDSYAGAYSAVQHLIAMGRRHIGTISGSTDITGGQERLAAYQDALRQHGLPVDPGAVFLGNFETPDGYTGMQTLLAQYPQMDAVFVANNSMTLGAWKALQERGIRVPDDIALVGFDDEPWYECVSPTITAVRQQPYQVGQAAVQVMLRRINGDNTNYEDVRLATELIVRESSGAVSETARP